MSTSSITKPDENTLTLKYSHNIIEHLGLKLYQNKPTNVIAELVSNSWDANASKVLINISGNTDGEQIISIVDDGCGMSLQNLKDDYLVIGKKKEGNRKTDTDQRTPMGRKGIGKLAPFGIADIVILVTVKDFLVNAFELNYKDMIESAKDEYDISSYKPLHFLNDIDSRKLILTLQEHPEGLDEYIQLSSAASLNIKSFLNKVVSSGHGTMILCNDIKLRKTMGLS